MARGLLVGFAVAALTGVVTIGALSFSAAAGGSDRSEARVEAARYSSASKYRRGPQVRGYVRRGGYGGYSYRPEDSINTYGNSRTNYGSADVYRDPSLDRQTRFGPFDHGFFYDSGILSPYGGNSTSFH